MKILVATDGSDNARWMTDFLLAFPFATAPEATVLTVMKLIISEADLNGLSEERHQAFEQMQRDERAEAQRLIDEAAMRLAGAGWPVTTLLRTGHPAEGIIQVAEEVGADIIAVGSHGMSGFKRFLLGSVSDRVLSTAFCSVLIVKRPGGVAEQAGRLPTEQGRPWRLLVAYDDSEPAGKAVEFCSSLSSDDELMVKAVSVLPLIRMYRQDIRQQLSWMWQGKKAQAREALEKVRTAMAGANRVVDTELVEEADVAQTLLDATERMDADLIVMGHKGQSGFKRLVLGSVTGRIAHHAPCSVLAVRSR